MLQITLTTKNYVKNLNTKTSYTLESTEFEQVTEKQHHSATCEDTCKWFRRLGGSESVTRNYTNAGYKVTKLISTSPNRQIKRVREYSFKWLEPVKG